VPRPSSLTALLLGLVAAAAWPSGEARALGAKKIYVNFDGGEITDCPSSSPRDNCSSLFSGTVLPYSGDATKRASIVQLMRSRFAPFGLTVTTVRPGGGDYDMEMVGDWEGQSPPAGAAGIAPYGDCWDNLGGEISFTLEASDTVDGMAEVILQEIAHTWGLEHVDSTADLLYPTVEGQGKTFVDECLPIVTLGPTGNPVPTDGTCSHHAEACGSFAEQNSHAELLLIFGDATPDDAAPTVEIVSPIDGAMLDAGAFDLVLDVQDNEKPALVEITVTIDGENLDTARQDSTTFATPAELTIPLEALPDGQFVIRVDATDESGNPASTEVTVTRGTVGETEGGTGQDSAGDTETGAEQDGGGDGCRSGRAPGYVAWWLLPLIGVRKPRRRCRPA
jgi:hypothetical protein